MNTKRVDFVLPSVSQFHALNHLTVGVYRAFQKKGFACRLLSLEECQRICLQDPPDMLASFNGAPFTLNGLYIFEIIDVPQISFLVDPIYFYMNLLDYPEIILTFDDLFGVEMAKSLGHERSLFFPQAIDADCLFRPDEEKEYDVSFLISFYDSGQIEKSWQEHFPSDIRHRLEEVGERALVDEKLSYVEIFKEEFHAELADGAMFYGPYDVKTILHTLNNYIKAKARIKLLDAIKVHEVHVWDKRWKDYFKDKENIVVHDAIDFALSYSVMEKSKITLCNSTRCIRGGNERVFNAYACGALPLTNGNEYFRRQFVEECEIAFYSFDALNSIDDTIAAILADEEGRRHAVDVARQKVFTSHTWDARVAALIPEVEALLETR